MRTEKEEERIRIRKTGRKTTTTTGWKCRERTRHKSHQNRLRGENVIRFFARGLSFTREDAISESKAENAAGGSKQYR